MYLATVDEDQHCWFAKGEDLVREGFLDARQRDAGAIDAFVLHVVVDCVSTVAAL